MRKPRHLSLDYPCEVTLHGVVYGSIAEAMRHADLTSETHLIGLLLQKYKGALGEELVRLPDDVWAEYEPFSWWKDLLGKPRRLTLYGGALARVVLLLRVRNAHRGQHETVDA